MKSCSVKPAWGVRFASGEFAGSTIGEVALGLRAGSILPSQVPIQFIAIEGQIVTLNNRSLTALRRAGMGRVSRRDAIAVVICDHIRLSERFGGSTTASPRPGARGIAGDPSEKMVPRDW